MSRTFGFRTSLLVLGFLLGTLSVATFAQQNAAPAQGRTLDRPALNLTQDQKDQIKQIRTSQHAKIMALRNDDSLSQIDRRAQIREVRKETRAQVAAILTPEQLEKLKQYRMERQRSHRGRRGRPASRPDPGSSAQPQ